jgi:hypothetical protein
MQFICNSIDASSIENYIPRKHTRCYTDPPVCHNKRREEGGHWQYRHCLVAASSVNIKMSAVVRIIRGISTTAAGTLNIAEL